MCQLLVTGNAYLSVFPDQKCVSYWLLVIHTCLSSLTRNVSVTGNSHLSVFPDQKCVSESGGIKRSSEKSADRLVMAQKYQLMNEAVQPVSLAPIIMREQERYCVGGGGGGEGVCVCVSACVRVCV